MKPTQKDLPRGLFLDPIRMNDTNEPRKTDPGNKLRVIVVILSLDREPWRTLEVAQRETWAREDQGIEIRHLRGITGGVTRASFLLTRKRSLKASDPTNCGATVTAPDA